MEKFWKDPNTDPPPCGKDILVKLKTGPVHEARFIMLNQKYHKHLEDRRIFKIYALKGVPITEVLCWRELPDVIGLVFNEKTNAMEAAEEVEDEV